jgi:hypothetical protein
LFQKIVNQLFLIHPCFNFEKKQKGGGGRKRKYFSFKEGQNIISKKRASFS